MHGWEVRERRRACGLSARLVARATGTSETNVAAYERGDKAPNPATLRRVLAAIDAGADSPVFVNNLVTIPAAAAAVRQGLRASWPTRDLLRIIRESRSNAAWIHAPRDAAVFFAAPSTTGDRRWDALLAGSTEDLALRRGDAAPPWTNGHGLRTLWFVGDNRFFDAYALAHSPPSLKVRGVLLDPSDLESV